jgi:carbon storage regulator
MLVLSRKESERIHIGDTIVVTVLKIQGDIIRLGIDAPRGISIAREELVHRRNDRRGNGQP